MVLTLALTAGAVAHAAYIANIGDHNATYGAFAALVILMLWAWMASLAFLFGAELDAELDARGERHERN
jgi:membrane protein